MLNCVSAEPITSHRGEQETCAIMFTLFPDPRRQHNDTGFGQWSTSFLASFTFTSNMRSLTEADVLSSNRGDLGEAEACLNNSEEERVIAATQPCISVWNRQECIDLRPSEETHKWTGLPFVGNREHALDQPRELGYFQRNVAKKRPNRSQSQITTPCRVRTSAFQIIQKRSQKGRL
jgi:hypothetical protein